MKNASRLYAQKVELEATEQGGAREYPVKDGKVHKTLQSEHDRYNPRCRC